MDRQLLSDVMGPPPLAFLAEGILRLDDKRISLGLVTI